jgi:hypothetical protein
MALQMTVSAICICAAFAPLRGPASAGDLRPAPRPQVLPAAGRLGHPNSLAHDPKLHFQRRLEIDHANKNRRRKYGPILYGTAPPSCRSPAFNKGAHPGLHLWSLKSATRSNTVWLSSAELRPCEISRVDLPWRAKGLSQWGPRTHCAGPLSALRHLCSAAECAAKTEASKTEDRVAN